MIYYPSFPLWREATLAQLVEHFLGKEEVVGSIPIGGSIRGEAKEDNKTTHRSN